jgi:hypothetical protein
LAGRGVAGDEDFDLGGQFRRIACGQALERGGGQDQNLRAGIGDDVGDFGGFQEPADCGVVQAGALGRPADFEEFQAVFHHQGDMVAGLQAKRPE